MIGALTVRTGASILSRAGIRVILPVSVFGYEFREDGAPAAGHRCAEWITECAICLDRTCC